MKKIYALLCTLSVSAISLAQSPANTVINSNADLIPFSKKIPSKSYLKVTSAGLSGRFDPAYGVMITNGVLDSEIGAGSGGSKVGMFVT